MSEDQNKIFQLAAEAINEQRAGTLSRNEEEPSAVLPWHELVADSSVIADDNLFMISRTVCELLEKGIVGLFGPTAGLSSGYVQSMCDLMEIPHIETRRDHLPNRGTCMINLHPYPPTLARVYSDLVHVMKWTSFTILYDTDESLPRINALLKLYDPKGYSVVVRKLDIYNGDGNIRSILKEVKENGERYFIVESAGYDLFKILTQAQQVGMISDHYHYIITTLDMHTIDLEPFQYGGANITGVRMIDPEDDDVEQATMLWREFEQRRGETLIESLEKEKLTLDSALMYDAVFIFAEALHQLNQSNSIRTRPLDCDEFDNWEHGYSLINYMRMVNWKGLSGILKFDHQGFRTDFMLQIVELTSNGLQKIGTWNSTEGLNITRTQVAHHESEQVANFKNKTFLVLTALSKPYGMLKDSADKLTGNDRYEGFGIDLIHELSLMLGFNYIYAIQEDNNYGSINKKTGEWEGMLREVMDGRADLAITDLTITSARESVVDFTSPFMNLGISILYTKAKKMPPELFSFMSPFSKELWYYMGAAYFSISFLFFLMGRLSPDEWMNPYPCVEEPEVLSNQFSLTNSFWFTIGSILQQGSEIAPVSTSTRVAAGTWWFFTVIMVSSYTANLSACLTVEQLFEPIKSAEDLAAQTAIQYGSKEKGSTEGFFKEATYPPYKKMYEYMQNIPGVMFDDNDKGVTRVKTTNYAYLMESTSIEYITQRDCDLQQVGDLLDDKGYGIAMRKIEEIIKAFQMGI
ncbi:glutamate receptor ionotropic, kainate 2-like isoform X2 [Chrysoperla carnea]|uniref:glutamate receptor ionotropic, kainate 2-like isoform X2 n=1 Tax=Chrysoperla carnea TaxID=189513 RepID=UPI001D0765C7|nr:glutamate receptor ionotropic, kainate 2-like isoform X2 [Chrysoperla carnea]